MERFVTLFDEAPGDLLPLSNELLALYGGPLQMPCPCPKSSAGLGLVHGLGVLGRGERYRHAPGRA